MLFEEPSSPLPALGLNKRQTVAQAKPPPLYSARKILAPTCLMQEPTTELIYFPETESYLQGITSRGTTQPSKPQTINPNIHGWQSGAHQQEAELHDGAAPSLLQRNACRAKLGLFVRPPLVARQPRLRIDRLRITEACYNSRTRLQQ